MSEGMLWSLEVCKENGTSVFQAQELNLANNSSEMKMFPLEKAKRLQPDDTFISSVSSSKTSKSVQEQTKGNLYTIIGQKSATSLPNRKRDWENWPEMMECA